MKKIVYRKSRMVYQSGIFISFKGVLFIIALIGFLAVNTLERNGFSGWYMPVFIGIVVIVLLYIFINPTRKINIENDYNGMSIKNYIHKKIKKRRAFVEHPYTELVGDYEYDLIIRNTDLLLTFYEKCQKEISNSLKEDINQIDVRRSNDVSRTLINRIENLKKIKELNLVI